MIPTAEEFLEDNLSNPQKGWSEKKRLIEFAKLHVQAAKKTISEEGKEMWDWTTEECQSIEEDFYPLENIK
jgi:hypothetical protein